MDLFLVFIFPVLTANLIHHFWVIKKNIIPVLAYPVDFNLIWAGKRIFGKSKTFRGFFVITILVAVFTQMIIFLFSPPVFLLFPAWLSGGLIGFMYCLGELPTSFLKRRVDILPSDQASGWKGLLFYILEQTDSVGFAAITAKYIGLLSLSDTGVIIVLGVGLHVGIDTLLYIVGYKKRLSPPGLLKKLLDPK